jgi:hypothetical protein
LKIKFIKIESPDGEIHFHECKTIFCPTFQEYELEEALLIARKEAKKPLLLNQKNRQ